MCWMKYVPRSLFIQMLTAFTGMNSDIRFGGADLHMPVTSDMMGELLKKIIRR